MITEKAKLNPEGRIHLPKAVGALLILAVVLPLCAPRLARGAGPPWHEETAGSISSSWELGSVRVDPLGDYFIGMGPDGRSHLEVRSPGSAGAYSAPQAVPEAEGAFGVDYGFEAGGGSWWIVTGSAVRVVHRNPGPAGSFETPISLETLSRVSFRESAAIGVSPEGDVLAVWTQGDSGGDEEHGRVMAAVKPAGSESFSAPQTLADEVGSPYLIGATLDAGGSAVVLWDQCNEYSPYCEESQIEQATRPAGTVDEPGFGSANPLATLHDEYGFRNLSYAEGPGGYAALAYEQLFSSNDVNLYARTRSPGAGFGPEDAVVEGSGGTNGRQVTGPMPQLSVASDGSAALAWPELTPCSSPSGLNTYMMASFAHPGSGFGEAVELASAKASEAKLELAAPAVGIARYGEWVGGWGDTEFEATPCGPGTETYGVSLAHSGQPHSPVLTPVGDSDAVDSVRAAANPVSGGYEGLVVWTSGEPASPLQEVKAARFEETAAAPGEEGSESPAPSSGGAAPPTSGAPGAQPAAAGPHLIPAALIAQAPLKRGKPEVVASCPPGAVRSCAFEVAAFTASGALGGGRAGASKLRRHGGHGSRRGHRHKRGRRAVLLGRGAATVPPGTRRPVRLHLTGAGRRLLQRARRKRRATRIRLVVTVSLGSRTSRSVLKAKLRPEKRKGRRKSKRSRPPGRSSSPEPRRPFPR